MIRILVCEPDTAFASHLKKELEAKSFHVTLAPDKDSAKNLTIKQVFHLVVWPIDESFPIEVITEIRANQPQSEIVATSSNSSAPHIVSCMQAGASQFWLRDAESQKLIDIISEALPHKEDEHTDQIDLSEKFPQIIGRHPALLKTYRLIDRVSNSDSSVLITGPSGTGKELIAQAIHQTGSRKNHPWVAVNCAAIPDNLLESELFGHVKGSFTGATQNRAGRFQLAGKGTLFLDEIGELNFDLQAKLLRAIQSKTFEPVGSTQTIKLEARIITATNQNLEQLVAEKKFREDLFYRLNVIPIEIPSLRSRQSDIPLLTYYFIKKFAQENQIKPPGITPEAMKCLMQYHWPGNIRELENLIERVLVLKEQEGSIGLGDFPEEYFKNVRLDRFFANVSVPDDGIDFNLAVNEFENELILQALQKTAGNKNKAACLLKLNRTTLVEKLKRKGLKIIP